MKKLTNDEFKERIFKVHGNRYNLSETIYINRRTPVKIFCNIHKCYQTVKPENLWNGHFSRCCAKENYHSKRALTIEEILKQFNEVHGNKYDYSKVNYVNIDTPVDIICRDCGEKFKQTPYEHKNGANCPYCFGLYKTSEEIIKEAKKIHGDKYDYSELNYINATTKFKIICHKPNHGEFWQTYTNHILLKNGCPNCRNYKGEMKLRKILDKYNVKYEPHYSFKDCKYKKVLHFDLYLKELNTCIEYDGEWHFKKIMKEHDFKSGILRDDIKNEYCLKNNIKLIRIPYWEYDNIEQILLENNVI